RIFSRMDRTRRVLLRCGDSTLAWKGGSGPKDTAAGFGLLRSHLCLQSERISRFPNPARIPPEPPAVQYRRMAATDILGSIAIYDRSLLLCHHSDLGEAPRPPDGLDALCLVRGCFPQRRPQHHPDWHHQLHRDCDVLAVEAAPTKLRPIRCAISDDRKP